MGKEINDKGLQDGSTGKYDPPSNYKDKEDYDKAWEISKAQKDQADNKYKPPSTPSWDDTPYRTEKRWKEREAYDKSWQDSQDNSDSQKEEKSGGCFITSACVEARGLPDNCIELQTLRNFRDSYIINLPEGKKLIKDYYSNAPLVVAEINKSNQRQEIYNWLYHELIQKSLNNIKSGDKLEAFNNYKTIFTELKLSFLNKSHNNID